jgi:hypothetical protein
MQATRESRRRWQEVRRLAGESTVTLETEEDAIATFGPGELTLFLSLHYRPNNALLAIDMPGTTPAAMDAIVGTFDKWGRGLDLPPPDPARDVVPVAISVVEGSRTEVIAVIRDPAPVVTGDGKAEVAWQLLYRDGVDGTLRRRLDEHGFRDLVPDVETFDTGLSQLRLLRAEVASDRALALLETMKDAFVDVASAEAEAEPLRIAKDRVLFEWDLAMQDPARRLRLLAASALAGHPNGLDRRVLQSLDAVRPQDVMTEARSCLRAAFLIRGPGSAAPNDAKPLPDARTLTIGSEVPTRLRPVAVAPEERASLIAKTLAAARAALGGEDALRAAARVDYDASCRFTASLEFTEQWRIPLAEGALRRSRVILGSVIRTVGEGTAGHEILGDDRRMLDAAELASFRAEAMLHPVVFLARQLREGRPLALSGRFDYRGRELLVLAWEDAPGSRIELGIDRENGLPRLALHLEWQPRGIPRQAALEFLDYQAVGSLRMPFLIRKFVEGEYRGSMELRYLE